MWLLILCCVTIITLFYYYNIKTFDYWKKRGIKFEKPLPLLGTYKNVYLFKKSRSEYANEMYRKYRNEKVIGGFRSCEPELMIIDPQLIKKVLTSDFSYFYMRGLNAHNKIFEPLRKQLFSVEGDLWRMLRQQLTPAFTSGKLRAMFPLIVERAEKLQARTLTDSLENRTIDAYTLMGSYTTDVIGSCGFGINIDSINDSKSEFRKLGTKIFSLSHQRAFIGVMKEIFPELLKHLPFFGDVERDMFSLVKQILMARNYEPIGRHDFIDLLLECRKKGEMIVESIEKTNSDGSPIQVGAEFDDVLLTAQVFIFFAAGYETSAFSSSHALHQLAFNPDVQRKVHEDVDSVMERHNNKISYDSIREMTYLEWTLKESLRLLPPLAYVTRKCTQNYTFTDIDLSIDKNTHVIIPIQGLHTDPRYWNKPEQFCPERFHPDNFTETQKSVYLPFGDGPRNCIGSRLGKMQALAGLAAILSKFTVEPAPHSTLQLELNPKAHIIQGFKGNLPLIFRERKKSHE